MAETVDLGETTSANNGPFAPAATITNDGVQDVINFVVFQNVGSNTLSINLGGFAVTEQQPGTWILSGSGSSAAWTAALDAVQIAGSDPTTVQVFVNYTDANGTTNSAPVGDTVSCFMPGTLIRTPDGEVPVETLTRGQLVLTSEGRAVPVSWLGVQTIAKRFADPLRVLPIRIKQGALGESVPARDLLLSPDHAIFIDGVLIQAGALVNGSSIVRETNVPQIYKYYHVETADHSLILAENTLAETFVDNVDRLNFDNWAEHEASYPAGQEIAELPYPRAKSHRQVPVRTRAILADRAMAIGAEADFLAVA